MSEPFVTIHQSDHQGGNGDGSDLLERRGERQAYSKVRRTVEFRTAPHAEPLRVVDAAAVHVIVEAQQQQMQNHLVEQHDELGHQIMPWGTFGGNW